MLCIDAFGAGSPSAAREPPMPVSRSAPGLLRFLTLAAERRSVSKGLTVVPGFVLGSI
jgi:hypothetical protein